MLVLLPSIQGYPHGHAESGHTDGHPVDEEDDDEGLYDLPPGVYAYVCTI